MSCYHFYRGNLVTYANGKILGAGARGCKSRKRVFNYAVFQGMKAYYGKSSSGSGGVMSASISPATVLYLEQSGLMYPGVGVAQC